MADGAGIGLALDAGDLPTLFGEDQARFLVAVPQGGLAALQAAARSANVPVTVAGRFGGDKVNLGGEVAPLSELSNLYRAAFAKAVG
jgi:phosphoribosylformylglycinamidine synthase